MSVATMRCRACTRQRTLACFMLHRATVTDAGEAMLALRNVPLRIALAGRQECQRAHAALPGRALRRRYLHLDTWLRMKTDMLVKLSERSRILLGGCRRCRHHRQNGHRTENCEFGHDCFLHLSVKVTAQNSSNKRTDQLLCSLKSAGLPPYPQRRRRSVS